jgi:UDPglucose 6-dehydrogenase
VKAGWIGLGKLGLCGALVLDAAGHQVTGYDVSTLPGEILLGNAPLPVEQDFEELLADHDVRLAGSPAEVVAASDIVFVSVQTPHAPDYGGETPAPATRRDFEYAYLTQACRDVCRAATEQAKQITLAVVSTVLPGTCGRLIRPLLGEYVTLVYTPAFIAMGTTIPDFRNPEFVLAGCDDPRDANPLRQVWAKIHTAEVLTMSVESAELAKVAYNVFISAKIVFSSTIMEICHKTGADCDEVIGALSKATDRLISAKYLPAGMPDGGSCHPRDLIAMSWLAQRLELSYDLLGELTQARESQTAWLADLALDYSAQTGLPVTVLGKAYKARSPLTAGSPGLLLLDYLKGHIQLLAWDPYTDRESIPVRQAVFVIAMNHPEFADLCFPYGSVVIDPWGMIPDQDQVTVIRVGRKT